MGELPGAKLTGNAQIAVWASGEPQILVWEISAGTPSVRLIARIVGKLEVAGKALSRQYGFVPA